MTEQYQRAKQKGNGAKFIAALEHIYNRLRSNPHSLGEPMNMLAMTKRRLLRWTLLLVLLAAFAVWLEPTRVVWGWLRGEAFYQGRPTSYWRNVLPLYEVGGSEHACTIFCSRKKSSLEQWLPKAIASAICPAIDPPGILCGDAAARAVLEQLQMDASDEIRFYAQEGLWSIEMAERADEIQSRIQRLINSAPARE